jgi:hypothetical protein
MFERCTERARRVIFFANVEANQFGSTTIETEHLLLGLRERSKLRRPSNPDDRLITTLTPNMPLESFIVRSATLA